MKRTVSLLLEIIPQELENKSVTLLCDLWYTKGDVLSCVKEHDNLELIAAVRYDTAIFNLPPKPNGKRGRNPIYGEKLNIKNLEYKKNEDYYQANKLIKIRLFKDQTIEIMVQLRILMILKVLECLLILILKNVA